jgi:hypothetical protein
MRIEGELQMQLQLLLPLSLSQCLPCSLFASANGRDWGRLRVESLRRVPNSPFGLYFKFPHQLIIDIRQRRIKAALPGIVKCGL